MQIKIIRRKEQKEEANEFSFRQQVKEVSASNTQGAYFSPKGIFARGC
jgi:hypothetical protein